MTLGCPTCAHLCVARTYRQPEDFVVWLAEEFDEGGGDLEIIRHDVSNDNQRIAVTAKCVACGQTFAGSANLLKSNAIRVPASWHPITPETQ